MKLWPRGLGGPWETGLAERAGGRDWGKSAGEGHAGCSRGSVRRVSGGIRMCWRPEDALQLTACHLGRAPGDAQGSLWHVRVLHFTSACSWALYVFLLGKRLRTCLQRLRGRGPTPDTGGGRMAWPTRLRLPPLRCGLHCRSHTARPRSSVRLELLIDFRVLPCPFEKWPGPEGDRPPQGGVKGNGCRTRRERNTPDVPGVAGLFL